MKCLNCGNDHSGNCTVTYYPSGYTEELNARIADLERQNAKMREALEFYASFDEDGIGKQANEILTELGQEMSREGNRDMETILVKSGESGKNIFKHKGNEK